MDIVWAVGEMRAGRNVRRAKWRQDGDWMFLYTHPEYSPVFQGWTGEPKECQGIMLPTFRDLQADDWEIAE